MAELQLSLRYKTLPTTVGFSVMCVLAPVWALAAPVTLGLFLGHAIRYPATLSSPSALLVFPILFAIIFLGILLTAITEDDRIYISKDGIAFPLFMLPFIKFRRSRSWSELKHADVTVQDQAEKERLLLCFEHGTSIDLKPSSIAKKEVEQLLLALELWGKNCERTAEFTAFQRQLQTAAKTGGELGYTEMWEDELRRRFTATSFVPLEPGQELKIGHIKIVRQLAFGGFSAIYLGQKNELDLVTVKEAVIPNSSDEAARKMAEQNLEREARMLAALNHDHIAKVLDYFVEENRHYLILEYINGQDLRQVVKQNGPQSEKTVIEWGLEIASILEYLHGQPNPIIHRDLTPENLVLRNDGEVMLIDFGAANEFVGTATGTMIGKQAFIAPEQLRGKATNQSDVYSFGGTLFYLLTGRDPLPLTSASPKQVLPEISSELDALVRNMTAFEATDRIVSVTEVSERFAKLLRECEGATAAVIQ
jgi:tRNA A-37 threonylcarbamoyl transferase component Bud32